jgi:hypothetical protein
MLVSLLRRNRRPLISRVAFSHLEVHVVHMQRMSNPIDEHDMGGQRPWALFLLLILLGDAIEWCVRGQLVDSCRGEKVAIDSIAVRDTKTMCSLSSLRN